MTILSWQIEFVRPAWFALLAMLPLGWIFWRWTLLRIPLGRKILSLVLRILLLVCVAAALAGPKATKTTNLSLRILEVAPPPAATPSLVRLTAPAHVRAGEPFVLDLTIHARSAGKAKVSLHRDATALPDAEVSLIAGENHVSLPATAPAPSCVVYEALVQDSPGIEGPERRGLCPVIVDPPPQVLLVESQPVLAERLRRALAGENVEIRVEPSLPKAGSFNDLDLIILSNLPAAAIASPQMEALQQYVRNGGGLIAVGGDRSFSAGDYRRSKLEELLPVISDPSTSKPKPSLAMVLVVDVSGSMEPRSVELAKEALRRAVEQLGPRDQVGILVFQDTCRWIVPLGKVSDKREIVGKIAGIATIEAEDGTNMCPPLERALLSLRESYADLKHIIVMTDGVCIPGDFVRIARSIAAEGVTMSTVGMGGEPVEAFLRGLAEKAKGRVYLCKDAAEVPRIFERDTGMAARIGITEEPFFPKVIHATQVLRGLDMGQAPTLHGYVETQARPESRVILQSRTGEPILALGRFGAGTTAAFTSDIRRWAASWLDWPQFGKFWVQLVRETMRPRATAVSRLSAEQVGDRLLVTLDAFDSNGRFVNDADVQLTVTDGASRQRSLSLAQIAPGQYAGSLDAVPGAYRLVVAFRSGDRREQHVATNAGMVERTPVPLPPDSDLADVERPGKRAALLWPWPIGLGLALLILDLIVRRCSMQPIPQPAASGPSSHSHGTR